MRADDKYLKNKDNLYNNRTVSVSILQQGVDIEQQSSRPAEQQSLNSILLRCCSTALKLWYIKQWQNTKI